MFKDSFIACVKVNGQILREQASQVRIPFGSEYSLLFKNLSDSRVLVHVYIDGVDQGQGHGLIIDAKSSTELERPFGDHSHGYRFKFIERTSNIEKHRGVKAEDGIVRIEFEHERPVESLRKPDVKSDYERHLDRFVDLPYNTPQPWYEKRYDGTGQPHFTPGTITCNSQWPTAMTNAVGPSPFRGLVANAQLAIDNCEPVLAMAACANEVGITVAGSESDQKFHVTSGFRHTYVRQIMTLQLAGAVNQVPVKEAVTVQAKPKCKVCGRVNKATSKYCSECGNNLAA